MSDFQNNYAVHPKHFASLGTQEIREEFLLEHIFKKDTISYHYTHYDRMIVGGILPASKVLSLHPIDALKADFFLERREIGIINVGGKGKIYIDDQVFELDTKDALYIGRGFKEVTFESLHSHQPALFYYNSCPAHACYPCKLVKKSDVEPVPMGSQTTCNARKIYKLLVAGTIQTCQVQMGLTELAEGSNWNTMPPHTHDRRMEAYFYFDMQDESSVCHFLGQPQETRHIWMKNHQAVLSPPWSIHSGVGTSHYSFIWGMAGENLDYGDMDHVQPKDLR